MRWRPFERRGKRGRLFLDGLFRDGRSKPYDVFMVVPSVRGLALSLQKRVLNTGVET